MYRGRQTVRACALSACAEHLTSEWGGRIEELGVQHVHHQQGGE